MKEVFPIDVNTPHEVQSELKSAQKEIESIRSDSPNAKFGLVMTGAALEFGLTEFADIFLTVSKQCQERWKFI